MNAQQSRRDEVALHIWERVKIRAKRKGCRVKKLGDKGARDGVINGALARLMEIDAVFPDIIRRRLHLRRVGNITVVRNINPLLWLAWVQVHREFIELGTFWHEDSDAQNKLIDRALDAERKSYLRATSASGGNDLTHEDLERFTDAGSPEYFEAEDAAFDAREEAAKEFEIMKKVLRDYDKTLPSTHRKALWFVCNEPKLTNKSITDRVRAISYRGIAPGTVAEIRDKFAEIAAKFLALANPKDAVETLLRKVETLEKEMAVIRAERRRDAWLRLMSPEEFEAYRSSTFFASVAEALGTTADDLLGATLSGPKLRT
jgi:hypothetical protein